MTEDEILRLLYLLVLLGVIGSSLLVGLRKNLNKTLQQIAIWLFIFVGTVAVYGLWDDIRNIISPPAFTIEGSGEGASRVTISRAADGHFHVPIIISGITIDTIIDTGASALVLSLMDAQKLGIKTDTLAFRGRAQTANGVVETARTSLDTVQLGAVTDQNIPALINSGAQGKTLLGMSYLRLWTSLEIRDDTLILTREK